MTAQNEPDPANVPPYEGRTTGQRDDLSDDLRGTVERQLDETKKGNPGEDGRHRTGTQGESQRPVGESTPRDSTGIDPQEPSGATVPASGSST